MAIRCRCPIRKRRCPAPRDQRQPLRPAWSKFRIIDAFRPVRAQVGHVMALLAQPVAEFVLELIAGMVRRRERCAWGLS